MEWHALTAIVGQMARNGNANTKLAEKVATALLGHPVTQTLVRHHAWSKRGLGDIASFHADHEPGPLKSVSITSKGKKRNTLSPFDHDYVQALYYKFAIIDPIALTLLHDDTHAYRPLRGTQTAVLALAEATRRPHFEVIIIDAKDCFHASPLQIALPNLPPSTAQYLVKLRDRAHEHLPCRGLPQGHPCSAAVTNIIISTLLTPIRAKHPKVRILSYSDDLAIAGPGPAAQHALQEIENTLNDHGIEINQAKTRATKTSELHAVDYLGYRIQWAAPGRPPQIRPGDSAYLRLSQRIETACTLREIAHVVRGWDSAYALSNASEHEHKRLNVINQTLRIWLRKYRAFGAHTGGTLIHGAPAPAQNAQHEPRRRAELRS